MRKAYTIVAKSVAEEDITGFGKNLSLLLQEWDEEVVLYDGGKVI